MSNKRKLEDLSENVGQKLKILIVESEVVPKNKSNFLPPKTLVRVPPPVGDNDSWFSFSGKEYYPVGIFDSNNKLINDSGKMIRYSVISNDANAKPYEVSTKPMAKGIYWFTIVKAHAAEQLTLRFSCDGVEPLVYNIDVIGDQEGGQENEEEEKSKKSSKLRKSDIDLSSSIVSDKIECDSGSEKQAVSRRASARFVPVTVVDDELPLIVDPADVSSSSISLSHQSLAVEQRLEESLVGSTHSDSANFVESILPMPKHITLNSKTRIEQPVGSVGGRGVSVVIKGPLFEVRLPLVLVRAVLDDKATNAGRVLEYNNELSTLQEADGAPSGGKAKGAFLPCNLCHPTAGELFQSLQERALDKIGSVGGNVESCVDTLRQLFEYFLEDHLLYPAERLAYRNRINLMRSQRLPFADEFGVYHFLRLLVLVISGAEIVGVAGEGSSSSKQGGGQQQDSAVNAITNYFTVASNLKGSAKQSKNVHSKMQDVLDLAIVLLDEQAHVLFY